MLYNETMVLGLFEVKGMNVIPRTTIPNEKRKSVLVK